MADTKISALTELVSVDDTADELAIVDDSAGSTKRITLATILTWINSVTATLTNKTLTSPKINEDVAVTATATELNHVDGVTSALQTQLDAKAPTASPTFSGTVTLPGTWTIVIEDGDLVFKHGGTERMRLEDTTGNLSITGNYSP
jgi:hypothetical protein